MKVEWDFEGFGEFPFNQRDVDGTGSSLRLSTAYTFDRPGTYFPSVKVSSNRTGDVGDDRRLIVNLGRARVVVR